MSFNLKNARATYQRLVDKIFKGMIGRNVEVYVDDIVMKLDSCDQHTSKTWRKSSRRYEERI